MPQVILCPTEGSPDAATQPRRESFPTPSRSASRCDRHGDSTRQTAHTSQGIVSKRPQSHIYACTHSARALVRGRPAPRHRPAALAPPWPGAPGQGPRRSASRLQSSCDLAARRAVCRALPCPPLASPAPSPHLSGRTTPCSHYPLRLRTEKPPLLLVRVRGLSTLFFYSEGGKIADQLRIFPERPPLP